MKTNASIPTGLEVPGESASAHSRRRLLLGSAAIVGAGLLVGQRAEAQTSSAAVFNVKTSGAQGDGINNDAPAIQTAMNSAWTHGGVVYFPPGRYRCEQKLLLSSSATSGTRSIAIIGEGRGVSCLEFMQPNSGIEIHFAAAFVALSVSGLSIKAGVANAGSALRATWPTPEGFPYSRALIEDLEICPLALEPQNAFWNYGIQLNGGHLSVLRAIWFRGKGTSSVNGHTVEGRDSTCAIELSECSDVSITGCHTNFSQVAFNISASEGTVIRDCYMVQHNVGVRSLAEGNGLPWMEVSSCHIFVSSRGIQVKNRNQASFSHNVIYQAEGYQPPSGSDASFVAIECQERCVEASIHDNKLVHFVTGGQGIVHSGRHSQINHNSGTMAPCVVLRDNSEFCVATGNISRFPEGAILPSPLPKAVRDDVVSSNSVINFNLPS